MSARYNPCACDNYGAVALDPRARTVLWSLVGLMALVAYYNYRTTQ